tara:strand:+ start:26667 stop:27404 length:738 start_codon:yes stop_codon:yes gene_type:complete
MISVSIVSHKQFDEVLNTIQTFESIQKNIFFYLITINVYEKYDEQKLEEIVEKNYKLIINDHPKGFGANHNFASYLTVDEAFIICNPDINLKSFDFEKFSTKFSSKSLYAPYVFDEKSEELFFDFRDFPSFSNILLRQTKKFFFKTEKNKDIDEKSRFSWFPGYFMAISKNLFHEINGFDENFFMYCEDVDLCIRVKSLGYSIKKDADIVVSHAGQYTSNKNFRYLLMHIKSIIRINIKKLFKIF